MSDLKVNEESSAVNTIRKRNGDLVIFESAKISNAIYKALMAAGKGDYNLSEKLAQQVIAKLSTHGFGAGKENKNIETKNIIATVEDVQDIVESVLIENGLSDTAKAYILYRHERRRIREEKMKILNKTDLDEVDKSFDINSLRVLAARYLLRDDNNSIIEDPKQLLERVAILVCLPDLLHDNRVFAKDLDNNTSKIDNYINEAKQYFSKINDFDNKLKIGNYYLNRYHFEALIRNYIDLAEQGCILMSFKELLRNIAEGKFSSYAKKINEYFKMMVLRDFLPNTPTLMNAGARLGQLSACFVLDMPDDMHKIMKSSTDAAMIFKSGGGVGINYSDLRPEGDIVASTSGVASGPTSFMRIIDTVTDVVKQGGKRRGANMGIIDAWHPDVEKFITSKTKPGVFENFNISVGIWDDFWKSLTDKNNHKYPLINPRTKKIVKYIDSHQLLDLISLCAWKSAEPGVIFFDNINKYNPCTNAKGGRLRATNPCGEQSLYPYESCNLGSINLANFVKRKADGLYEFDWQRYEETIRIATRFLDNIIDVNKYPIDEIDHNTKLTRRIGLGIMGIADLLFLLRMPYNSMEGYEFMNKLAESLSYYSMEESVAIAKNRGSFPIFNDTDYVNGSIPVAGYYEIPKSSHYYDWDSLISKIKQYGIRNSWTTTIAPTGTLSMIADTSNGVEPVFALVFEKRVTVGRFFYTNKIFEQTLKENNLYTDSILMKIANNYGSIKGIDEIPKEIQKVFVTAIDLHWSDHLMAQAVWQKWISNAIAKTINMSGDSTVEDVKSAYLLAHELGLKGVTVYRDGSRHEQVLHVTGNESTTTRFDIKPSNYVLDYVRENVGDEYVLAQVDSLISMDKVDIDSKKSDSDQMENFDIAVRNYDDNSVETCPNCNSRLVITEGCNMCIECGFSSCISG